MSDQPEYPELRTWIQGVDFISHYRESDIYTDLTLRQIDFLHRDGSYENPVLIPEEHFEDLVVSSHNRFVDRLSSGEESKLKYRAESLPTHLESLTTEIREFTRKIEPLEQIENQFTVLDDRFDTLDEAAKADALPEETQIVPGSSDSESDGEAVYNLIKLSDEREWRHCPVFFGSRPPLRVAAYARLQMRDLRKARLSRKRGKAMGQLRLEILRYILKHKEITGFPPERRSRKDVVEEAESAREEAERRGGRPKVLDEGELEEAFFETVRKYCDCWHEPGGRYEGIYKKRAIRKTIQDNTDKLTNPDTGSPFDFDYLRNKINSLLEGMSQEQKDSMREEACGSS
jgi:hypothetical protein